MLGSHVQRLMNVSLPTVRTMHSAFGTMMQLARMLAPMLVANLANTKRSKKLKMTETLAYRFSSESTR